VGGHCKSMDRSKKASRPGEETLRPTERNPRKPQTLNAVLEGWGGGGGVGGGVGGENP